MSITQNSGRTQSAPTKTQNLDDDPSVVAPTEAADLLSVKRHWDCPEPLALECGATLYGVQVAYEAWGTLNAAGDNAIYICHALTGDAHAAGRYHPSDKKAGWWNPLIGPGRAFDTDRYFVVCANLLGGCQGTTGPASPAPVTGKPYGSRFPTVTVRDMVRLEYLLLRALGVNRLACVTGGSLGGMQALEWLVSYPDFVAAAIPIAASMAHSAQGIAFNLLGRQAIMLDPAWQGGDYYDSPSRPDAGLALARMVGMISASSTANEWTRPTLPTTTPPPASRWRTICTIKASRWCTASTRTATCGCRGQWTCTTSAISGAASARRLVASRPPPALWWSVSAATCSSLPTCNAKLWPPFSSRGDRRLTTRSNRPGVMTPS